jgi:chitodextrinase
VGVVGYKILRSGIPIATSTLTTYSDTSVAAGTTYSYSVQAFDAAGKVSPASAAVSAMVPFAPDTIAPSIPTNLTATSTSSQVILNWTASTDNVAVTGYKVRRNDGQVTTAAANSYTDVNVVQGQSYSYTVAAYDLAGNASNQSASVTATVKDTTLPTPPPGLNGAAPDSTKVNLSWSASTDNVGVTGYNVYRNAAWIASTPGLSYSDTSGVPGTTYTYTVKAYDAAGNISAASGSVNVAVPAAPVATPITPPPTPTDTPPTTPTNLTATISGSSVVLSWTASTDNLGVTGYRISRGSDVFSSSGTSFTNTSVTAGVTYTYTVAAVDTAGQLSGPSNSVTITVPTSVSILSNSIANITSTTASITWTTSVASIGYFYYGTTPTALNLYISVGTSGTSHTVTLSGLIPNTLYGYSITAVAGTNRSSVKTPTATFTTLP